MSETESTATDTTPTQGATTTESGQAVVDTPAASDTTTESTTTETPEPESLLKTETPEGPPEQYEVGIPQGLPEDFKFDTEVEGALKGVWREMGLSQTNAQKFLDQVWPVMHRRQEEQSRAQHMAWIERARNHPEFGGEAFEKNRGIAQMAIQKLGNAELNKMLDDPVMSHPDVFHFVWKVGKLLSEDEFVGGETAKETVDPNDRAAVAKAFYGDADV